MHSVRGFGEFFALSTRSARGSIAGADYDPVANRYGPAEGGRALAVAGEVAARITATLRYE